MFPAVLVGRKVNIVSHVVKSGIPLLWSRPSMAKAGVVLDLLEDKSEILGKKVDLELATAGYYALFILPRDTKELEQSLITLLIDKEKEAVLVKLHRQFSHPREKVMASLLKTVRCNDKEKRKMVETIHGKCSTCKRFQKTPPSIHQEVVY